MPITYYSVFGFPDNFPADLRREVEDTARRWNELGNELGIWAGPVDYAPCVWYDREKKTCGHYENRPPMCRDFPVGGEACLAIRHGAVCGLVYDHTIERGIFT